VDARLIGSIEVVTFPFVAVTVGVLILQILRAVARRRVSGDVIPGGAIENENAVEVIVGSVGVDLVVHVRVSADSRELCSTDGIIDDEGVVAADASLYPKAAIVNDVVDDVVVRATQQNAGSNATGRRQLNDVSLELPLACEDLEANEKTSAFGCDSHKFREGASRIFCKNPGSCEVGDRTGA